MVSQDPDDDAPHDNGASASAAHNNDSHHDYQPQPIPRSQVKIPLEPLTLVSCRRRHDGEYYAARIIEKRLVEGSDEFEYYVHYRNCERVDWRCTQPSCMCLIPWFLGPCWR